MPASMIGLPHPRRIFWRLSHISCGSLGSAPRWVEKNNPLGTPPHPTAPRKLKALFDHKLAALAMPARPCGQYQMFSKTCGGHKTPSSLGHELVQCVGKCSRTLGHTLLSACTAQGGCTGQIQWEQQEGHK